MERNLEDVDKMLDRQFKFEVSENRKILRSIIDTIGLALRGLEMIHSTIQMWENILNFIELLNHRVRGENKDLEKHLES